MNTLIEQLFGVDSLTDQVLAMDLLNSAKAGIRNYAVAATEAATPEVKQTFERHLFEAIDYHANLTEYLMKRGFYQPYNMDDQLRMDRQTAQTALNIPS